MGPATRDVWHEGRDRRPRRSAVIPTLWLAFVGLPAGCWAGPAAAERAIMLAAASTAHVVDEAIERFDAGPDDRVVASYAGTSALARQIESGAPADIFLAANAAWMDHVEAQGLIEPGSRHALAGNRLVFVTGDGAMAPFEPSATLDLAALLDGGRLAIGNPEHVPAGIYARQALEALGLWPGIQSLLAPAADVRAALALVARRRVAARHRLRHRCRPRRRGAHRRHDPGDAARAHRLSGRPRSRAATRRSRRASSSSSSGPKAGRPSPAPASSSIEGTGGWR